MVLLRDEIWFLLSQISKSNKIKMMYLNVNDAFLDVKELQNLQSEKYEVYEFD